MPIQMELGLESILSYRRLSYTPWHALAEFVDNSTQSYFNNRESLDASYERRGIHLRISVVYERQNGIIRISDNAMGMSYEELRRALHIGLRPEISSWRSKYGMGMKTAACWLGNAWTVTTKKLGEDTETSIAVDVETVATGVGELPETVRSKPDRDTSYTVVEISDLNNTMGPRRLGRIRTYLASMYREDISRGTLDLEWQNQRLTWDDLDKKLLVRNGETFKREFEFTLTSGRTVRGWVGILARGTRSEAGFSILHADRVIKGWPESYRPESIYGQIDGSNDLVNQRLLGELFMDDFDVSHTKDDILWAGGDLDEFEDKLKEACNDYRNFARRPWKSLDEERGPSAAEKATAVDELRRELESSEFAELITIEPVPSAEAATAAAESVLDAIRDRSSTFDARIGSDVNVRVFLEDRSANDPYVVSETANPDQIIVVVNNAHPHVATIQGANGFLNYLRHCVYDAVAEWQAARKTTTLHPETVKLLKDRLLRTSFEMEQNAVEGSAAV